MSGPAQRPHFGRLAVIGVGLIGGSAALAWRQAAVVDRVVGAGRGRENLERALALGLIDEIANSPAAAVAGADLVLVAVPVGASAAVFAEIAPKLSDTAIVTDAGSTKAGIVMAARAALGPHFARFVAGHPVAGTEHSGADAAVADLYAGRRVILTPTEETAPIALDAVRALWQAAGAEVSQMDAQHHDRVLAATSHLPHVLAYALVDYLARADEHEEIFAYAAGGVTDFTRIASSSPEMWADIVMANRDALLPVLDRFREELEALRQAIANGDCGEMLACFERAKAARDTFTANARR